MTLGVRALVPSTVIMRINMTVVVVVVVVLVVVVGIYTYRYTVTTRMTYALRWAAMRAILMFDNCEGQSHKTVSTDHKF